MKYMPILLILFSGCFNTSSVREIVALKKQSEELRKERLAERVKALEAKDKSLEIMDEGFASNDALTKYEERITCLETLTASLQEELTAVKNRKAEGVSAPVPTVAPETKSNLDVQSLIRQWYARKQPYWTHTDGNGRTIDVTAHLRNEHQIPDSILKTLTNTEKEALHSELHEQDEMHKYPLSAGRLSRGIQFTSDSCGWCKQMERNEHPKLSRGGWSVGTSNTDNLEVVDINSEKGQSYLMQLGWNGAGNLYLPKIIKVEKGKIVREHTGFLNAKDLANFLNGTATPPQAVIRTREKVA